MKDLMLAFGLGAVAGSRSLLAPAVAVNASVSPLGGLLGAVTRNPAAPGTLALLAVAEAIADKSPWIPARTEALPLTGRLMSGALTASACARPGRGLPAALAGAAGALAGTFAFFHLRRLAGARLGASNLACGLAEDATALASGMLLARCRRPPAGDSL
jgi:uncharacterized membrane protein